MTAIFHGSCKMKRNIKVQFLLNMSPIHFRFFSIYFLCFEVCAVLQVSANVIFGQYEIVLEFSVVFFEKKKKKKITEVNNEIANFRHFIIFVLID